VVFPGAWRSRRSNARKRAAVDCSYATSVGTVKRRERRAAERRGGEGVAALGGLPAGRQAAEREAWLEAVTNPESFRGCCRAGFCRPITWGNPDASGRRVEVLRDASRQLRKFKLNS